MKRIVFLLTLLLFVSFGLASLQLFPDNVSKYYVGLINSTSLVFVNSSNETIYYYSPSIDTINPTLIIDVDIYGGTCSIGGRDFTYGIPTRYDAINKKVWLVLNIGTASNYCLLHIHPFDLLTKSVGSGVYWNGNVGAGLGFNSTAQTLFWIFTKTSTPANRYINLGFTNGTQTVLNTSYLDTSFFYMFSNILEFNGIKYAGISYQNIYLWVAKIQMTHGNNNINMSIDNLGGITTGYEKAPFLFVNGNAPVPYMLFSSNEVGNYELYWASTNQTATKTRLTTTVASEYLQNGYQSPYGTVYFTYTKNNYVYYDYFCPLSNSALGQTCAGETGYAGEQEGGFPSEPRNITQQANLYLKIIDKAECPYGCSKFAFFEKDWIEAFFLINGVRAPSNSTCLATNEDGDTIPLVYNKAGNPFDEASVIFSENLRVWVGKKIIVSCYNGYNISQSISGAFYIAQTDMNNRLSSKWTTISGEPTGAKNDIINYRRFLEVQTSFTKKYNNGMCFVSVGSKNNIPMKLINQIPIDDKTNYFYNYFYETGNIGFTTLPIGYNTYKVMCGSWFSPEARDDTVVEQRQVYVKDTCGAQPSSVGSISTSFFVNEHRYNNATFYYKQKPIIQVKYSQTFSDILTEEFIHSSRCSLLLSHSNGTLIKGTSIIAGDVAGGWISCGSDCQSSDKKTYNEYYNFVMSSADDTFLPIGNYTYDITCSASQYCINDVSKSGSMEIAIGAGCEGTVESCGTTGESCNICGSTAFTCENGNVIDLPQQCINQYCVATDITNPYYADFIKSPQCSIFSVSAGSNTVNTLIPCSKINAITLNAKILKNGKFFDAENNVMCRLGLFQTTSNSSQYPPIPFVYDKTMVWNSQTKQFEMSFKELANDIKNTITNFDKTICGKNYLFKAYCDSDLFVITHEDDYYFSVGAFDFCTDGTISGACVFERTNNELDKPLFCDASFNIINNSEVCGCPTGMKANITANDCSGLAGTRTATQQEIKGWLIALFNNWWLLLIILIFVILVFKSQRVQQV